MKKLIRFVALCVALISVGCSNSHEQALEEIDSESLSNRQIATQYVDNMLKMNDICSSRSATDSDYPLFLYGTDIVDKNGNKIFFEDFSEEEKQVFYEVWKEKYIENLEDKMGAIDSLAGRLVMENKAFIMTEKGAARSVISNPEKFLEKYLKNLEKLGKTASARNAGKGENQNVITEGCNNHVSIEKMKSVYKKGRVLVCTDYNSSGSSSGSGSSSNSSGSSSGSGSSSNSSGGNFGHASIMSENEWNPFWEDDARSKATVTSYALWAGAQWEGKTDGVQYEPIGVWTGTSGGSSHNVSIFDVGSSKWVWAWFKSHYEFTNAPDSAYNGAAEYAKNQIGKGYWIHLINKNDTSSFYCSQLCYKAWIEQSSAYDLSFGTLALPSNIASSSNSRLVVSYSNW